MNFVIKNLGIVLCSNYYFIKLLKMKISNVQRFKMITYAVIISWISYLFKNYNGYVVMPIFVVSIYLVDLFITKAIGIINFVIFLISVSISYMFFVFSAVVVSVLLYKSQGLLYGQIITFCIQVVIMQIPFLFKRTKSGMPFLMNVAYNMPIILVCIMVICLIPFVNNGTWGVIKLLSIAVVLLLAILLFIYWRTSITRHYLERLSLRNIDSLNNELDEKNALIKRLIEDKDIIEKLNHKNYKLVPAMQGAVMHYLTGVKEYMDIIAQTPAFNEMTATEEGALTGDKLNGFIDEGNRLIEELKKMSSEWTEFVNNENLTGDKEISSCGIPRVDYILSYMHDRSLKEGFLLKIDIEQSVDKLTEKIISEEDVATLVADLIENAIIATRHNNREDILVRLGVMKKEFILEVYDSGTPFDKDVLAKYGKEKITTHADDNGSGIGMMQTYEILGKCGASLYIDELSEESGLYTKRISIVFNKKNQYVLYTKRSDDEIAYLHKRSDMMIIRK